MKQYKVCCEISGTGLGAFKKWERLYNCKNKDEAIELANKELDVLKQNRNILITGFICNENIGGI